MVWRLHEKLTDRAVALSWCDAWLPSRIPQVKRLVCTECSKPCRTIVEQELHTKRTGHTTFEDQVCGIRWVLRMAIPGV